MMRGSTCDETSTSSKAASVCSSSDHHHHKDVLIYLESLGLGEDGPTTTVNQARTTTLCNNAPPGFFNRNVSSSAQNQSTDIYSHDHEQLLQYMLGKRTTINPTLAHDDVPESPTRCFISPPDIDIWAYDSGDNLFADIYSRQRSSMDYTNNFSRNLNRNTVGLNHPCYGSPCENQFTRQSFLNNSANVYNMGSISNGFSKGNRFKLYNNMESCSGSLNQFFVGTMKQSIISEILPWGCDIVAMTRNQRDSQFLQALLQSGDYKVTERILPEVLKSIFEVITHQDGYHVFQKLVDVCDIYQLGSILVKLTTPRAAFFMAAAFDLHGSLSIQRLVKRLKKTDLASNMTTFISPMLCDLMMHQIGRYVAEQCIKVLGNQPNEVLYEEAIKHFRRLATDKHGCLSLNVCIDHVTGNQRERLINLVVEGSNYLSHDPIGNHIVQHVLKLADPIISERICIRLKGNYVELSSKKGGSHVVEKCIKFSSNSGITCVVEEIYKTKNAPSKLSQNEYGNFVMQTALKRTKADNPILYESLVVALHEHIGNLKKHPHGKQVIKYLM